MARRRLAPFPSARQWAMDHPEEYSGVVQRPGRQWQPSDRPRPYEVKAEDIVAAAGAGFAAAYADEAALWYEAAQMAREFNKAVERGEQVYNTGKDVKQWVEQQFVRDSGDRSDRVPTDVTQRRARKREYYADESPAQLYQVQPVSGDLYPGKMPPGWAPGRPSGYGPGGARAAYKQKGQLGIRYERY